MTKQEAFKEINETQDYYVNELLNKINSTTEEYMKVINFQSPTGTGKTKMMAKLMNLMPDVFFIVTTLSKGQLDRQIETNLKADCKYDNFAVYGCQKYTVNSKLQANDILSLIPANKQFIWLRDEGHINTNRWEDLLKDKAFKMINITATPDNADIKCNFTNTMMLRTVHQNTGTPEDAIKKLLEVKKQHSKIKSYNPCAIFRCIADDLVDLVITVCQKYNLKYINITEEDFNMSDLCKDDNEYDVIINKFKIVEGIDIRRAHVLYLDNQPSSNKTTIQVIGRCRRNALLYNNDVDIFDPANKTLLKNTRQCFVYYNVEQMHIDEDENGELASAFCDVISVEQLKANSTITVEEGILPNGLKIIELGEENGTFRVLKDPATGFNIVKPEGAFYEIKTAKSSDQFIELKIKHTTTRTFDWQSLTHKAAARVDYECIKIPKKDILNSWHCDAKKEFNYALGKYEITGDQVYHSSVSVTNNYDFYLTSKEVIDIVSYFKNYIANVNTKICMTPSAYYSCRNTKSKGKFYRVHKFKTLTELKTKPVIRITQENFNRMFGFSVNENSQLFYNEQKLETRAEILDAIKKYIKYILDLKINTALMITDGTTIDFTDKADAIKYITDNLNHINIKLSADLNIPAEYHFSTVLQILNMIDNYRTAQNIKKFGKTDRDYLINSKDLENLYYDYNKIINDRESAIIGTDLMKQIKNDNGEEAWLEDRAVTSKINKSSKLNTFIETKYQKELEAIKAELFTGKNKFNFDAKCNRCLGYCVEYYSKYLVYGELYLGSWLKEARKEAKIQDEIFINDNLVIRACMLKYRELMVNAYGSALAKRITTIGAQQLIRDSYAEFVKTVIELGTKTANFVKQELNITKPLQVGDKLYDPNLSIKHIAGLADYINKDTIIDIKTTNNISKSYVKQVLAYHYLSTKRSDLDIKTVIVYDAVSGRSVKISL